MAGKPRKPRPNRKVIALSDARSGNILEANRTVGYAPSRLAGSCVTCEQLALRGCSANRLPASVRARR